MKASVTRIQSTLAVYLVLAAFVLGAAAIPALAAVAARAESATAPAAPDALTAADAVTTGTVTNCTWAGAGGLQAALAGGGTVIFACDGTIVVPEIVIIQDTVLDGTTHNVTLSGNNANRVLRVAGGSDLTVRNLTIANGQPQGSGAGADNLGGGINAIAGGDLTIENSVFENNKSLRLAGDNLAKSSGGAILYQYSNGALTIRDSTFRNNQTGASGGALYIVGNPASKPSVTITGSAFSGNQAGSGLPNSGGAIAVDGSVAITITNSTLSGNSAYQGGGLALLQAVRSQNMTARLTHVTLAGNTATLGAGFYSSKTSSSSQTIDLANTIVGGGCIVDSGVALNSLGYNLSSDSSCGFTAGTDLQNTDPQLAALADNGGPTQTRALNPGSPAINKIPLAGGSCNNTGVTADQRGYARPEPSGTLCDIGAYEANAQPPADASLTIVKQTVGSGGVFTFTSTTLTPSPFTLAAGQSGTFNGLRSVSVAGWGFNCALTPDGNVSCWDRGAATSGVPAGPFIELEAADVAACGLRPNGSVECWGDNIQGDADPQAGPYTTITMGGAHSCGLTPAGAVECWGANAYGQSSSKPGPYVDISAMKDATCGLTPAGALECWGFQTIASAGPYTQISGGRQQVCALQPDGAVACFGFSGALTSMSPHAGPFVEISTLDDHACGLRPNGRLECWGAQNIRQRVYTVPPTGTYSRLGTTNYRGICAIKTNGAADCMGPFNGSVYDKPGPFAQGSLNQKTFSSLLPGAYDVTEQVPANWNLTSLTCDGGNPQVNGATVSVTLAQSQHVTCTYTDTYAPPGTIIISKQTAPADPGGTQQFVFTDNITAPNSFTLVDGGEKTFSNVPTGVYTVAENDAPGGYYLADLTCAESGGQANSSGDLTNGQATIHLEPGETVRCAYTNALANAIIVEKVTNPYDPNGNFDFDFTIFDGVNSGNFGLKDGEQESFIVAAGTYTITEGTSTFHQLRDILCTIVDSDGNETPVGGDLNTRSATLTLAAGEVGFCRFINDELATLTVVKEAFPPDGTEFTFDLFDDTDPGNLLETFVLSDTSEIDNPDYLITGLPGTAAYVIKEENVAGWANLGIACELEDGTYRFTTNVAPGEYKVQLNPGEDVTCTYTNVQEGKINVTKQATPADGTVFNFVIDSQSLLPSDNFTLTHGTTKQLVVPFGQYDLGELLPVGWQSDDVQCAVNTPGGSSTFVDRPAGVLIDLGPGEEVSCTFANSKVPNGTLNIVKEANPADDTPFTFTIGQQYYQNFTLTDPTNNTQTFSDVPPGGYRVIELQDNSTWELTGITCVESVTQNSQVSVPLRTAEIQVDPGETVTCTFSNQDLTTGTINIIKLADPQGDTSFGFTSDIPGSASFSLVDDGQSAAYIREMLNVPEGSYTVTETAAQGWNLEDVTCYDDNGDSLGDTANARAQIELLGGEEVTCIFSNQKLAGLTVVKHTSGGDGTFDFTSTSLTPNSFNLTTQSGTAQKVFTNLLPGTYDVAESVPAGWDLNSATCTNGSDPSSIDLAAGENVICTFTDTKLAALTVVKQASGGDGVFDFTSTSLTPNAFSLTTTSSTAQQVFSNLAPGTYDVAETVPAGWELSSAVCSDGSQPGSISLAAGESVTCTFTNSKLDSLTIVKKTLGGDDTFGFTSQTLTPGAFSLTTSGGSAQQTFTGLTAGVYDVTEVASPTWQLASATCDNGDSPDSITLGTGEAVTCTFTNLRRGSLTVIKNTVGGDGAFNFSSPQLGDFSLATTSGTAQQTFTNLAPGNYGISETAQTGWDLISAVCSDGSNPANITLGNGEAVTCTFTNQKRATLTVVKHSVGGDGAFDFTSPQLGAFNLTTTSGTAQQTFSNLAPGPYKVAETVPVGWDLTSAACTDGSSPDSIDLAAGESVVCTFTNSKLAKLTIIKQTIGGDGTFDFTSTTLTPGAFSIKTASGSGKQTLFDLLPGAYDLAESVPAGWDLIGAACSDGSQPASIDLAAGEAVTCTFTNQKRATLTVVKNTVGGDGAFDFSSTSLTPASFSLTTSSGTAQQVFNNLVPGVYDVSETVPAGWDLSSAACSDGSSLDSISLAAGENVTCTFTNTKLATLTVVKQAVGGDGTFTFISSKLGSFSLTTASGTAQQTFSNLVPGTYDVVERVPSGWNLTSAVCSDGSQTGSISLAAGENVTCTFTNTKQAQTGSITIVKNTVGGDGTFDFTSTQLGNFSLTTVNGTAQKAFTGLQAGTYAVSEKVPAGWSLTSAVCSDGSNPSSINLAAGENVTCTFTNTKQAQTGSITIVKNTVGGDGTFDFTSQTLTPGSFSLTTVSGTAQRTFSNLAPGTYDVSETVPAGWQLTSAVCSDGSQPGSINLAAGENVTCTFTNTNMMLYLPLIYKN